jgi:hypothetical protein
MNIAILIIALLAMVGAGTGIGLAATATASVGTRAGAPASARDSAAKHLRYVLFDCLSKPQVEPAGYIATCADDGVASGGRPASTARW